MVRRDEPDRVIGYVERSRVMAAWVASTRAEGVREEGWLTQHMRLVQERLKAVFAGGR